MLGILWKISFPHLLEQLHWISAEGPARLFVLRSSWLFCWASELNSASRWQPNAPSSASLCDAPCSDDPLISSREVRTAPLLLQECSPTPSPVSLMNILTGMAQNLDSPFLWVSSSFTKQNKTKEISKA